MTLLEPIDEQEGTVMAATNESDLMSNEDEWDEEMEASGPALYYVALWYQALHPLDKTYADVPGANSEVSEPPDIFNRTKHLVWEAKSGSCGGNFIGAPLTESRETFMKLGTNRPDTAAATTKAEKQLSDTLRKLNSEAGSDLWMTGTLQNDPELAAFFDTPPTRVTTGMGSWCDVLFSDGTTLSIKHPTSDGVLLYQVCDVGGTRLVPIGEFINPKAHVQAVIDAAKAHPPVMEPAG